MAILTDSEWEIFNQIILDIYKEEDSQNMRRRFLEMLRQLVVYNIAEFSIGHNEDKFYDPVEVNMDSKEEIHFLDKYFYYLNAYGNKNIDWVFRNPNSIVMRVEDIMRGEIFENSQFNTVYLKSIHMKHCCTASLAIQGEYIGEFSLYLAEGYGNFTYRDLYVLEQFKDHLTNRLLYFKQRNTPVKAPESQYVSLLKRGLSNREIDVFLLVQAGKTNEQIADELFISVSTVKKHIGNIFSKLDLEKRSQIKTLFYTEGT